MVVVARSPTSSQRDGNDSMQGKQASYVHEQNKQIIGTLLVRSINYF
jgi:hypothetical protein